MRLTRCDHSRTNPLTRPSDTFSPSDGERDGVRGFRPTLKALWNKMKNLKTTFALGCAVAMVAGCGPSETETPPSPSAPAPMPELSASPAPMPGEAVFALAPVPAATSASNPAATAAVPVMEDEAGERLTDSLAIVQRAVQLYEENRSAGSDEDGAQPWPELQDLSQLVKARLLPVLPPAPPGQKFVLDPQTKQVSLAP
jgi:hypothetical protein